MYTLFCMININEINYKLAVRPDNERMVGNENDLRQALKDDPEPDFEKYDFSQPYFIFEIYDKSLNEYVSIDHETEIENLSKIRVKILDPEMLQTPSEPAPRVLNEEEMSFLELSERKDDVTLVEMYAEAHVPDEEIIKMIDSPYVTAEGFSIKNIRVKKQMLKSVIKYQGMFNIPGTFHDMIWENICSDIKDNLGYRVLQLIGKRRKELGFVNFFMKSVQMELNSLIGQYNRILRMCQFLTPQLADRLWPLFRLFHTRLRIDYIFPEKGPSTKIMQKEFDDSRKIDLATSTT